jgi:hypothetical protein
MKLRIGEWLGIIVCALIFSEGYYLFSRMTDGQLGARILVMFIIPLVSLLFLVGDMLLIRKRASIRTEGMKSYFDSKLVLMMLVFFYLYSGITVAVLHVPVDVRIFLGSFVAIFFFVGGIGERQKGSLLTGGWWFGNPSWLIVDNDLRSKMQRLGGTLMQVGAGVVAVSLLAPQYVVYVTVGVVLATIVITQVYTLFLYKRRSSTGSPR